jgi:hypothetical protein
VMYRPSIGLSKACWYISHFFRKRVSSVRNTQRSNSTDSQPLVVIKGVIYATVIFPPDERKNIFTVKVEWSVWRGGVSPRHHCREGVSLSATLSFPSQKEE